MTRLLLFFYISSILFVPIHSICQENIHSIYDIKKGDSYKYIKSQSDKYGFKIDEKTIVSENGEQKAFYLYKKSHLILIIVFSGDNVQWIDIYEQGYSANGVVVGSSLYVYHEKKSSITFYGHRDCSLEGIVCIVNGVKTLIDISSQQQVSEYIKTGNTELLNSIYIKGVEI